MRKIHPRNIRILLDTILAQQIQNIVFSKVEPEKVEKIVEVYKNLQDKWELEVEEENSKKSVIFKLQKRPV